MVSGQCPARDFECNFEVNPTAPCSASVTTQTGNANWMFANSIDHTMQTNQGHYAMVEESTSGDYKTRMSVNFSNPAGQLYFCLQFWYILGPSSNVSLDICESDCEHYVPFGNVPQNNGQDWSFMEHDLTLYDGETNTADIIFQASYTGNTSYMEKVAVDDIKLIPGKCLQVDKCDFEGGLCSWNNDEDYAQFDWLIGSGSTNGPIGLDHTTGTSSGHYIFAPLTPPRQIGDMAILVDSPKTSTKKGCLRFFYWSYSKLFSAMTSLKVVAATSEGSMTIWVAQNSFFNTWQSASVPVDMSQLNTSLSYQLQFVALFDSPEYNGVMAIDDVLFDDPWKDCPITPGGTDPQLLTLKTLTCDFSANTFCEYQPLSSINGVEWKLAEDPLDGEISATIDYKTLNTNFLATLISPSVPGRGTFCVDFSYAFHGINNGDFYLAKEVVYQGNQINSEIIFARSRSQGYKYRRVLVPFDEKYDFRLNFKVSGSSQHWSGTLSIRNVQLFNGECSYVDPNFCDFERDFCDYKPIDVNNSWQLLKGSQLELGTDQTTGTPHGQTAGVVGATSMSQLERQTITKPTIDQCLIFYYQFTAHQNRPTLKVIANYSTTGQSHQVECWTHSEYFTLWQLAYAQIPSDTKYDKVQMSFQVTSPDVNGTVVIDDVRMVTGTCPVPWVCDWEESMCGYKTPRTSDKAFVWISPASVDNSTDAPVTDHTTGSRFGHYLLLNVEPYKGAAIQSPLGIVESKGCVEVWYQMKGDLTVLFQVSDTAQNSIETGGQWWMSRVNVEANPDFWFEITAYASSNGGFVAVDDVIYYDGVTCESLDSQTTPFPMTTSMNLFFLNLNHFYQLSSFSNCSNS